MASLMKAADILNRTFFQTRARVLEIAADLDRLDRAGMDADLAADERLVQLKEAISILIDGEADRAARVQMTFSDPYDAQWKRPRPRN
jgi:hypothetical protein